MLVPVTIYVSTDNEATASPWWVIINPVQNMNCDVNRAAGQITGPFFSREEAERTLKNTHYNYSKRACVYCMSGHDAYQYHKAVKKALNLANYGEES